MSKNREGYLDLDDLSKKLAKHQNSCRRLIGLFSSASRLTGILADDVATTILLHQYGAISIWDYSHAAPFAPIQTNSPLPGANKDVVFFSTNKFVGGVQAPGEFLYTNIMMVGYTGTVSDFKTVSAPRGSSHCPVYEGYFWGGIPPFMVGLRSLVAVA